MILVATVISAFLSRADLKQYVVVAGGDEEIERAHAAYKAGVIVGYVSLLESPEGLVIARQCANGDVETAHVIDTAIDQAMAAIGGRTIDLGETMGAAS